MWLRKAASFMEKGLSPLTSMIGKIGAGIIGLMMLVTVVDVVGRRTLNHPLPGSMELSTFMMVIVVFFSIAHCELFRGHITIDLVVSKFRQRPQDVIDSIMYVFFLVVFSWMTQQLYLHATQVWRNHIVSGVLEIPAAPFVFLATLGCGILSLLVLMHLLLFLAGALKK